MAVLEGWRHVSWILLQPLGSREKESVWIIIMVCLNRCLKTGFRQQKKNDWIEKRSWLTKTDVTFDVYFGKKKVTSRLYDIDVVGYDNGVNKLRLFDIESLDESIVKKG